MPRLIRLAAAGLVLGLAALGTAVPPDATKEPKKPTPDAEQARARVTVPAGLKVELWASEPLLANPVAFAFDERGKCYVAETYRLSDGVTDTLALMTRLASAVLTALETAGPDGLRSVKLLNASEVAPANAPASAEFCAWLRAVMNMPTSIASVVAARNPMKPRPT